jgi:hypothetical protein
VLTEGTQAEKIHQIGHVVVLFRRNDRRAEDRPAALMDLSLDRPEGYLFVRRVGAQHHPDRSRAPAAFCWHRTRPSRTGRSTTPASSMPPCRCPAGLQPELVILGTGQRQTFPAAAFMAGFLAQGRRHRSDGQRRCRAHLQPAGG